MKKIIAKSALIREQIEDKFSKGANSLEIALFGGEDLKEGVKLLNGYEVDVIHMPIEHNIYELKHFVNREQVSYLEEVCMFAKELGGEKVIIIHNGSTLNEIGLGNMSVLSSMFKYLLDNYENLHFAFENLIPIMIDYKAQGVILRNAHLAENVDIANYFNKELKCDSFGTVLDTCHAKTTVNFYKDIHLDTEGIINKIDLDTFFKKNKDVCKLIHLADVRGLGLSKGAHGIPFGESGKLDMYDMLDMYRNHGYTCPITIEVSEEDYNNSTNFKSELLMVKEYKERQLI